MQRAGPEFNKARSSFEMHIANQNGAYQPTQSELAKALGVSLPMVQLAKRLSPLARQAVMGGKVKLGHYARPAAKSGNDDEALLKIIARRGVNHVVDIAAAVEAAQ
jgi:hypothetical protein